MQTSICMLDKSGKFNIVVDMILFNQCHVADSPDIHRFGLLGLLPEELEINSVQILVYN